MPSVRLLKKLKSHVWFVLFLEIGCRPAGLPATPVGESATARSLVSKVCAAYAAAPAYEDTGLLEETSPLTQSVFPPSIALVSTHEAQFRTEFGRLGSRMLVDV